MSSTYVIITALKNESPEAYKTFTDAIDTLSQGQGVRFTPDAILIRYNGNLSKLQGAVSEHLHEEDELAILQVTGGIGLFSDPQTALLFSQAFEKPR
jgi:hypothetical protein